MKKKITWLIIATVYLGGMHFATADTPNPEEATPFIFGSLFIEEVDPLLIYGGYAVYVVPQHLEGLNKLALDKNGTWNDNGTDWTIELREDVKWHDGTPFTASDVKWNWDRLNYFAQEGLSAHSHLWFNDEGDLIVNETVVLNDHMIKFVLNKNWKDFIALQGFLGCFLMKPIVGKEHTIIELDEYDLLIGTGPFILTEVNQTSGEVIFLANNDYYRGAPDIQKLIFKQYDTWDEERQAFKNYECHLVEVHPDDIQYIVADPDLDYGTFPIGGTRSYQFNVDKVDWSVRKAMQYAFDYDNLITEHEDIITKLHHPVPQGMIGFNPDLPGLPYYDVDVARQYLIDDPLYGPIVAARVNDTSDDQVWIDCATNDPLAAHNLSIWGEGFREVVDQFVADMAYIGVNISIEIAPWPDFGTEPHNISFIQWGPDYWHPTNMLEPLYQTDSPYNFNGLANATIDGLMSESHTVIGTELEALVDEIVTGVIVEQAAAMYVAQRLATRGWVSKVVSNVDDIFTGDMYFYNIEFALSEAPSPDTTISGFPMIWLVLGFIGTVVLLQYRKRNMGNF